ncbi:hypothetical protein I4U23_019254 [Adineta vaga]|nr:hypothetical protein I4U23_019254 [Adineta vaga]
MIRQPSKSDETISLCLNYTDCDEKLPYICERLADIVMTYNERNESTNQERVWTALIGPALNLVGSIFGSNQQPAPQPQPPEIQIITAPSEPQAQAAPENDNTILYIVLAVVTIIIVVVIILLFFCGGGLLYFCTNKTNSIPHPRSRHDRSSIDSNISTVSR